MVEMVGMPRSLAPRGLAKPSSHRGLRRNRIKRERSGYGIGLICHHGCRNAVECHHGIVATTVHSIRTGGKREQYLSFFWLELDASGRTFRGSFGFASGD